MFSSQHDQLLFIRKVLPYGFLWVNVIMALIYIGKFYRIANRKASRIGSIFSHYHLKDCRFTRTIGPNNTHYPCLWEVKSKCIVQQFVSKSFFNPLGFNYISPQTWSVGNKNFQFFLYLFLVLVHQFIIIR